jgi:DNA-cytosine methyltransferase
VLSLFDGISCGQVALERAGIDVDNYFASEIDKHAIKVTQSNYPDTIQLGDVRDIDCSELPKIDLLIGGSPCQGFSYIGKHLNFEDPKSKLFFEYARILNECNPTYFMLENVRMKKEYMDVITETIGVEPIEINSSLVSAQSRPRIYWTNIPNVEQPTDLGIKLNDVLEDNPTDCWLTESHKKWWDKNKDYQLQKCYSSLDKEKAICMTARQYASWNGNYISTDNGIRKLSPIECERLQNLPDGYTDMASTTQRYKMLGNAWTVGVIEHIFKNMGCI